MKTILIYDQLDAELRFYVVPRDVSYLDGTYVNQIENNDVKEVELLDITEQEVELTKFPEEEMDADTRVIVCGFLP